MQQMLHGYGLDVEIATTSSEGLAALKRLLPDVVIMNQAVIDASLAEMCCNIKGNPSTASISLIILQNPSLEERVRQYVPVSISDYTLPNNMFAPRIIVELLRYWGCIGQVTPDYHTVASPEVSRVAGNTLASSFS
jgi:response regulator RpfG family c-di-GMP phosphodiesterase